MRPLRVLLERAASISKDELGDYGEALQSARGYPNGFWHPEDLEAAIDVLRGGLEDLGVASEALSDDFVAGLVERYAEGVTTDEDEELARRRQIAEVVAFLNGHFEAEGAPHRLHGFAEDVPGWESDEPVWLLLASDERAELLRLDLVREQN